MQPKMRIVANFLLTVSLLMTKFKGQKQLLTFHFDLRYYFVLNLIGFIRRSFIHSDYFYSASSSPLLLRAASDTARILCRNFTPKRHRQL